MSEAFDDKQASVILLDIEGTTTPIDFVYKTLFPFARAHTQMYLRQHSSSEAIKSIITRLGEEQAVDDRQGLTPPPFAENDLDSVSDYIYWLMDRDRKSTPLKELQGLIWEEGYNNGELHSQVFDDVPLAMALWREQGKEICIYSSGSVLAQKILFANTEAGDLTKFIRDYFDTNIGSKREAESYRRIAEALQTPANTILFASDVTAELEAATLAGLQTILCLRPGNPPQPEVEKYATLQSFDELFKL